MLDRRLSKLVEGSLGINYVKEYPNDFSKRIIVQKVLYLLTHGKSSPKIKIPYRWSFYLRGPYSSEIAHMLYHINDHLEETFKNPIEVDENDKEGIENFIKFKEELIKAKKIAPNLDEEELYELIATITYAALQIGNDEDKLFLNLKNFKPELTEKLTGSCFKSILEILSQHNYI